MERRLSRASAMSTSRKSVNSCQREFMTSPSCIRGLSLPARQSSRLPVTTIVVNPNDRAAMDEYRNIRIHLGA